MGNLTTGARTAMSGTRPVLHSLLEVGFPDSTGTRRYSDRNVESDSLGLYRDRVRKWGTRSRVLSDDDGQMVPMSMSYVLDDGDQDLFKLREGEWGNKLEDCPVLHRIAMEGGEVEDWATVFAGVVDSLDQGPGVGQWTLNAKLGDIELRRPSPDIRFLRGDFPGAAAGGGSSQAADKAVIGKVSPIYYGRVDSSGVGGKGAVPLFNTNNSDASNEWTVGLGPLSAVTRVFDKDGAKISSWTAGTFVRNGKLWTRVVFPHKRTGPISADIVGMSANGVYGGDPILNPMRQLAHYLANFVYNRFSGYGAYFANSAAPIDLAYLEECALLFDAMKVLGTLRVDDLVTGYDVIADWLRSFPYVRAGYTFREGAAKIAFRAQDWRRVPTPVVHLRDWQGDSDAGKVDSQYKRYQIDKVVVKYQTAGGKGDGLSLGLLEPNLGFEAQEPIDAKCILSATG